MSSFNRNFNNNVPFTTAQYEEFKRICNSSQPHVVTVAASQVTINSSSSIDVSIYTNGQLVTEKFVMEPQAFESLLKLYGIPFTVQKTFTDYLGNDTLTLILSKLKTAMSASDTVRNKMVLVISKKTGKVINIVRSNGNVIKNDTFFKIVEGALNGFENNGMKIKNLSVSPEGNIAVTVLNDNWTFDVFGLKDEYFTTGMSIIKTANQVIINPFNERLTCTNGNVTTEKGLSIVLNSVEQKAVDAFFEQAINFGKGRGLIEQSFKLRTIEMLSTNASFAELETVYNNVRYNINNTERALLELEGMFGYHAMQQEILKVSYGKTNIFNEKAKYKSKVITDMSVWDLMNKLTFISSNPHKHDLEFVNGNDTVFYLQRSAGSLMFKEQFDLSNNGVVQIYKADAYITNADLIEKIKKTMK